VSAKSQKTAVWFLVALFALLVPGTALAGSAPVNTAMPSISGVPQDGQTLTASPGTWSGSPAPSFSYEWYECDSACADTGQSGTTYTLGDSDYSHQLEVKVTASNSAGSATATSERSGFIGSLGPTETSPPTVSGSAEVGNTLVASPGTWLSYPAFDSSFVWFDCDSSGGNCTDSLSPSGYGSSYTLTAADVGYTIEVEVYVDNGNSASAMSGPSAVVTAAPLTTPVPTDVTAPTIAGPDRIGATLAASPGAWAGAPSYSYEWYECDSNGVNCSDTGTSGPTYALGDADYSHQLEVQVTATNGGGSAIATSATTGDVTAGLPAETDPPTVSGTPEVGNTLTASAGTWSSYPVYDYSFVWFDCDSGGSNCIGSSSPSGNGPSYTLTSADVGHTIKAEVVLDVYGGAWATSSATAVVTAAPLPGASGANTSSAVATPTPTSHQVKQALAALLPVTSNTRVHSAALLQTGYRMTFHAPGAGRLVITWTATVGKRQYRIATFDTNYTGAKTAKVTIKLTAIGKKLLGSRKRVTVTASSAFTPAHQKSYKVNHTFTLTA
jgi:hypothetical protein